MFTNASVLDEVSIPNTMKFTGVVATLRRTKELNRHTVPAARIRDGMERLVNIANEMDEKLESLLPGREGFVRISDDRGKLGDTVTIHAVPLR